MFSACEEEEICLLDVSEEINSFTWDGTTYTVSGPICQDDEVDVFYLPGQPEEITFGWDDTDKQIALGQQIDISIKTNEIPDFVILLHETATNRYFIASDGLVQPCGNHIDFDLSMRLLQNRSNLASVTGDPIRLSGRVSSCE
ncbi:MAG: hypothetical protein OHK0039_38290 [Bacteroidia bacterium]